MQICTLSWMSNPEEDEGGGVADVAYRDARCAVPSDSNMYHASLPHVYVLIWAVTCSADDQPESEQVFSDVDMYSELDERPRRGRGRGRRGFQGCRVCNAA